MFVTPAFLVVGFANSFATIDEKVRIIEKLAHTALCDNKLVVLVGIGVQQINHVLNSHLKALHKLGVSFKRWCLRHGLKKPAIAG